MITILNQMAEKWYGWELAMLWQVGVLIAIVAVIDLLIKKWAWPQVRYAMWMLILVKLVLPPSLTSPTSFTAEIPFMVKQTLNNTDYNTDKHETQNTVPGTPYGEHRIQETNPKFEILNTKQIQISQIQNSKHGNDVLLTRDTQPSLSWKVYVMFVWLGGAAILTGWLVVRLRGLRREQLEGEQVLPERLEGLLAATAKRLDLRRIPQIILTDKVCCPAVFGVFRPVLLMPAGKLANMTAQDAENIFLHELAHIKRGDLFVHAVYMILQIAYWFNPLVWLIRKPLQNLRELCCDATVARLLREKTAGYRQTLLDTARELLAVPVEPGLGLLGLFENSSWLLDRLRWLEKKSWKYRPLRIATIFILICFMATSVLPMAKFQAVPDFVIRGTVTDAETGKPIAGAKVGDTEKYADGKFFAITDANGNYSYKTYYEEHILKCRAAGYKITSDILLVKLFGKEKEKIINFALEPGGSTGRIDYSSVTVEEGIGFDDIIVSDDNCTIEFLKSRLGQPEEEIKDTETNGYWIVYKEKYGLDFWFDEQKILREIRLNKGFNGELKSGISMDSSQKDVFAVYGEPIREEFTVQLPKSRGDRILFKVKGAESSKIYYEHKGLLFWFDGDSIRQIVIHPSKTEPAGQANQGCGMEFMFSGRIIEGDSTIKKTLGYKQGQTLYAKVVSQQTQQDLISKLVKQPGVSVLTSPQVLICENETGTISISGDHNQTLSFDICVKAEDDGILTATISYSQKAVIDFEKSADAATQNKQIKSEDKITTSVRLKSGQGMILPVAEVAKSYRFFVFSVSRKTTETDEQANLSTSFDNTQDESLRAGSGTGEATLLDKNTDPAQIKNIMATMGGTFYAAQIAIQSSRGENTDSAAKIMKESLPQFEQFESAIQGTSISDSVHLIIEQIRQAIEANKDGDFTREEALITASRDSWSRLTNVVEKEIREKEQEARYKEAMQKMKKESQNRAGQDKADDRADKASKTSGEKEDVKKARTLRVTIYEGNDVEPDINVNIPLTAVKILRQILPAKDKLQIIAQKIKLDESLPEDINSAMLIDMLDEMLKQIDEGVEATTLVEVKDGDERIIIALE